MLKAAGVGVDLFAKPRGSTLGPVETSTSFPGTTRLDEVVPNNTEDVLRGASFEVGTGNRISNKTGGSVTIPFMIKALVPHIPIGKFLELASGELGEEPLFGGHVSDIETVNTKKEVFIVSWTRRTVKTIKRDKLCGCLVQDV